MSGTVKLDGFAGHYRVLLDGEEIGYVRRYETRYNLRRVIVSRGWRAVAGDVPIADVDTRREAVAALVDRHAPSPRGGAQ